MRHLLSLTLLAALLSTASAHAARPDVIVPGTRPISHTYTFVGLDAFPENRFLLGTDFGRVIDLEEGSSASWYKLASGRVYAVSADFVVPELERQNGPPELDGASRSLEHLSMESAVPDDHPASSRNTVYRITAVEDGVVRMELVRDVYLDAQGEVANSSGSGTVAVSRLLPFLGLGALLALVGIAFLRGKSS
jgi:hypothetical protein